jgi:hypothetical protein
METWSKINFGSDRTYLMSASSNEDKESLKNTGIVAMHQYSVLSTHLEKDKAGN